MKETWLSVLGFAPVEVSIPELSWKGTTVIKEIQTHPWKNFPDRLSFHAVKG